MSSAACTPESPDIHCTSSSALWRTIRRRLMNGTRTLRHWFHCHASGAAAGILLIFWPCNGKYGDGQEAWKTKYENDEDKKMQSLIQKLGGVSLVARPIRTSSSQSFTGVRTSSTVLENQFPITFCKILCSEGC